MAESSPVGTCQRCGEQVLWIMTEGGARIALSQGLPTYIMRGGDARRDGLPLADESRAMVAHALICDWVQEDETGKE